MRSLSLTILAVAALLTPTVAMAATPAAPSATADRYFEIRALAYGGTKLQVGGKIAIEGSRLMASAGCNMIGGEVSLDGDHVAIVGALATTEMACPGTDGDAEALLIKILALGAFTITDSGWIADGGEIDTVEIPVAKPGPAGSPPDEPVSSGPIATIVDPAPGGPTQTCPPIPTGSGTNPIDTGPAGGPISGSGSGSSGSGSSGSGTSGSTGTGTVTPGIVVVGPDATSGSEPGATPGSAPGATPDSAPGATPGSVPGATPASEPAATPIDLPLATGSVDQ
jgi:heat shock protein HslJ